MNDNGPENVVACTVPLAEVFSSEFGIFEITKSDVDAMLVESDVVVAPAAVMFWNEFVPVNVLFEYVFGIVVEAFT